MRKRNGGRPVDVKGASQAARKVWCSEARRSYTLDPALCLPPGLFPALRPTFSVCFGTGTAGLGTWVPQAWRAAAASEYDLHGILPLSAATPSFVLDCHVVRKKQAFLSATMAKLPCPIQHQVTKYRQQPALS